MTGNLPPGVSPSDPDAPWNRPDPEFGCMECLWSGMEAPASMECPDCGGEVQQI